MQISDETGLGITMGTFSLAFIAVGCFGVFLYKCVKFEAHMLSV